MFVDTEATGLPKRWNQPYSNFANWPSAVQVAWVVYKSDGTLVKTENHYVKDQDVELKASAIKIHGITRSFLNDHGEDRRMVMQNLANDLINYQPLVIGHFMEFDHHVASADFCRSGISNPLESLPQYCTMLASSFYVRDPSVSHLRLGELYTLLFDVKLENPHNALTDAQATAQCFFELLRRGDITDEGIDLFQHENKRQKHAKGFPWFLSLVMLLVLTILVTLWI